MPHIFESAKTGRAKCRACSTPVPAGTIRFGERVPNPFADDGGETTHWFHVPCAAFMRPDAFLEGLKDCAETLADRDRWEHVAKSGLEHRRLPRVAGANRAASGRAACRACKEPIAKDTWRIALSYYDEGRFAPSGFIHITCAAAYLETSDAAAIVDRIRHFSPELSEIDLAQIQGEVRKP